MDHELMLFIKGAVIFLCVLVLSVAGCTANKDYQTRRLLESGADPLATACAMGRDGASNACLVLSVKK